MKCLLPILLVVLLTTACVHSDNSSEPSFPDPVYPRVALTRQMLSIEGVDTVWGDKVIHEYDAAGRYLTYSRYNNQGMLQQRITHTYSDKVDTIHEYDGAGNLTHVIVYSYLDDAYLHEPNYSDNYYRNPVKIEVFNSNGVLLQMRNSSYDLYGRLTQADGLDVVDSSTFVCMHVFSPYKCESSQVNNPGTERESTITYSSTYYDSLCHYLQSSTSTLSRGDLVTEYKYDSLGRLVTKETTAAGIQIERIEYDYYPDHECEIIFDDKPLRGYIRYYE